MEIAAVFGAVCFIAVIYKTGMTKKISSWFSEKKKKAKLALSLLESLRKNTPVEFSINDTSKSATILYSRLGRKSIVFLPFNRQYVSKMVSYYAELIREGNKPHLNITQQPGIPYLVSAKDLGGLEIRITNQGTGCSTIFGPEEIPGYAAELFE